MDNTQAQGLNQNIAALTKTLQSAFIGNIRGQFTMSAAASTTITSSNVTSTQFIFLTPMNAAAGTLQGSAKCLYAAASNGSFVVTTASGASAAGTEIFGWVAG